MPRVLTMILWHDLMLAAGYQLQLIRSYHDYREPNAMQPTVYVTIIERATPPFYVPSLSG